MEPVKPFDDMIVAEIRRYLADHGVSNAEFKNLRRAELVAFAQTRFPAHAQIAPGSDGKESKEASSGSCFAIVVVIVLCRVEICSSRFQNSRANTKWPIGFE